MSTSINPGTQLRFDFYKSLLTWELATLGAEITLLHSLFKDAPFRVIAYVAILMIALSCVFLIGAKEVLITRVDPFPTRNRIDKFLDLAEFSSPTVERVFRALAALLYAFGLFFFIVFILLIPFFQH
jgi:hypothetical protein